MGYRKCKKITDKGKKFRRSMKGMIEKNFLLKSKKMPHGKRG